MPEKLYVIPCIKSDPLIMTLDMTCAMYDLCAWLMVIAKGWSQNNLASVGSVHRKCFAPQKLQMCLMRPMEWCCFVVR